MKERAVTIIAERKQLIHQSEQRGFVGGIIFSGISGSAAIAMWYGFQWMSVGIVTKAAACFLASIFVGWLAVKLFKGFMKMGDGYERPDCY